MPADGFDLTGSFMRKGQHVVVHVAKRGKYKGKFRKKKVYEKYKKVSDSMLKHHQESMSAGEPTESQYDHSDISDPLPSAGGGIQYDNWTEQKQNDDSDSTHDTTRVWRVVELDLLANVGKKNSVHL